jgi:hypothetical protein
MARPGYSPAAGLTPTTFAARAASATENIAVPQPRPRTDLPLRPRSGASPPPPARGCPSRRTAPVPGRRK